MALDAKNLLAYYRLVKITIDVTQENIDCGEFGCAFSCPIAIAVKQVTGGPVRVYDDRMEVGYRKGVLVVLLPTPAQAFVHRFDQKLTVSPFSFDFDMPEKEKAPQLPETPVSEAKLELTEAELPQPTHSSPPTHQS